MRFAVYHKDGTKYAETNTLDYSGELMGERTATISIKSPYPLDIMVGDYVMYRDEKFELRDAIGVKKQCTKNMYGESFTYSNIKLESYVSELKDCLFLNITYTEASSGTVNNTLNSKFTFNCNNVMDLAARIQANLDRFYGYEDEEKKIPVWHVKVLAYASEHDYEIDYLSYVDASKSAYKVIGEEDVNVEASDNSCYEMLQKVYDTFKVQYVVDKGARVIRICSNGNDVGHAFTYGKGNGLRDIEKVVDSDYDVVTVLHVYGSEKNMPQHYYYNKSKNSSSGSSEFAYAEFTTRNFNMVNGKNASTGEIYTHFVFDLPLGVTLQAIDGEVKATYNGYEISFHIGELNYTDEGTYSCRIEHMDDNTEKSLYILSAFSKAQNGVCDNLNLRVSAEYVKECPDNNKSWKLYGDVNLLSTACLMLPEFSSTNLNPTLPPASEYATNSAILRYGIREGVVRFDTDDDDNGIEEIYPTIENSENTVSVGSNITDDGIYDSDATIKNFTITIKKLGFDLNNTRPDGQEKYGTLCMKDGMCGGREFDIVKYDASTNVMTLKRVEDDSLKVWFPTKDFTIASGDHFVITDIEMPETYVDTAAKLLEEKGYEYLNEHNHPHYTYNVSIDNQFMAKQHRDATTEESFYWNVKEGDVFKVGNDTDLNLQEDSHYDAEEDCLPITIDKLTIKESADKIPQYSISLRNEKRKNTIAKLQNSISKVSSTASSAHSIANTKSNIRQADVINIVASAMTDSNS